MNTKYLYCKYQNFKNFIHNGSRIRFTDIYYYKKLENEKIRDNEDSKKYFYEPHKIDSIQFGDITINSKDIVKDIVITQPVKRAHVLCLSKNGYNKELFNKFNADICIKLNIDLLLQILNDFFKNIFLNNEIKIISKDIEYYGKNTIPSMDPMDLVFKKTIDFKTENEYRVAIFYPYDSDTIIHFKNKKVKVFGSTKDMNFIEVGIDDDIGMKRIILEIKTKNGTLIKP
ncbi:MAG: hypothetical protein KAT05_14250 [Spirochaetes bacterium]|nr:hypothetical protein [Spirochaetota bacterium]